MVINVNPTLVEQLQDLEIEVAIDSLCQECEDKPERWESSSMMLFEAMSRYNGLVTTCLEKINALEVENSKMKAAFKNMKDKVNALEKELKRLSHDRHKLVLGQVAFEIESEIVRSILDRLIGSNHYINGIEDMEYAIRGADYADVLTEEKRGMAGKNWRELKQTL